MLDGVVEQVEHEPAKQICIALKRRFDNIAQFDLHAALIRD